MSSTPTMPTLRHADPETATRFPLPVGGPVEWQAVDGGLRVVLPLPDLISGTIVVPSLALSWPATADGEIHRYRWTLHAGTDTWPLPDVPSSASATSDATGSPAVSGHIDCWHVHRPVRGPRLQLDLLAPAAPPGYLLCVSSRPLTLAQPPLPATAAALTSAPPARSQMTAPEAIASRICSPTAVSMVLNHWGRAHDWLELVAECHDPATQLYGVWPLALAAAARRGSLGAVEVFESWKAPLRVLRHGVPLVTSIRFSAGELPGAPLDSTSGHLVVVYAAGPEEIAVCDPAATEGEVLRRYPAAAFSGAWLRHRGAAYILPP